MSIGNLGKKIDFLVVRNIFGERKTITPMKQSKDCQSLFAQLLVRQCDDLVVSNWQLRLFGFASGAAACEALLNRNGNITWSLNLNLVRTIYWNLTSSSTSRICLHVAFYLARNFTIKAKVTPENFRPLKCTFVLLQHKKGNALPWLEYLSRKVRAMPI